MSLTLSFFFLAMGGGFIQTCHSRFFSQEISSPGRLFPSNRWTTFSSNSKFLQLEHSRWLVDSPPIPMRRFLTRFVGRSIATISPVTHGSLTPLFLMKRRALSHPNATSRPNDSVSAHTDNELLSLRKSVDNERFLDKMNFDHLDALSSVSPIELLFLLMKSFEDDMSTWCLL